MNRYNSNLRNDHRGGVGGRGRLLEGGRVLPVCWGPLSWGLVHSY